MYFKRFLNKHIKDFFNAARTIDRLRCDRWFVSGRRSRCRTFVHLMNFLYVTG